VPQKELCQGDTVTVVSTASMSGNPTYQWTINGQPISQGASLEFGTVGREPGTYKIGLTMSAEGYNDASAGTAITVRPYRPPTGSVAVSPAEIWYGEKATVTLNSTPGECGGALGPPAFSASEGSVTDGVFDSSSVQFDPSNNAEQRKTVTIVAKISDQKNSVNAESAVVVKKKVTAKRLPDIIFPAGNSRVNNCGKRVLLEELKPYLENDPTGKAVLVGHVHEKETATGLDQQRALNAAAVISAGQGVCYNFAAAQILVGLAGSTEPGGDYQAYFCGTSTVPATNEVAAGLVDINDGDAKFRRVEVWFVPTGGEPPAFLKGYVDAASLSVASLGCPR
jgi:outer membrane protein OmpA-like peptidoglycan-associated protein